MLTKERSIYAEVNNLHILHYIQSILPLLYFYLLLIEIYY